MHNSIEWKGCHSLFKNGYEKTLIFESLPFVSGVQNSTVIIVSPLHSIITEQLQHYGQNSLSVSPDVIKGLSKECGTKETDCTCTCVNCNYSSFCAKFIKWDFTHGSLYFCCIEESVNLQEITLF